MKRCILLILAAVILAWVWSIASLPTASKETLSTVYTISGIMFSVGLGAVISLNTQGIHNREAKAYIKKQIKEVITGYLFIFTAQTIAYIFIIGLWEEQEFLFSKGILSMRYSDLLLFICLAGMGYYTANFLEIYKLNCSIEEKIDKEHKE